jgi:hypothetical protein
MEKEERYINNPESVISAGGEQDAKLGDPAVLAGYLGKSYGMDEGIARFAFAYAEQTDRDYEALVKAAKE